MLLPWLAHHIDFGELTTTELARHILPPEQVTIAVEGSVRSATVEMAFKNYAEVFPDAVAVVTREPKAKEFDPDCDVFVYLRSLEPPVAERRQEASAVGIPIIYALDDDLLRLYGGKPKSADLIAAIERHLREADAVIVYSRSLVDAVAARNPRVTTLLMNMPARYLDRPAAGADARPTRYLIIGRLVRQRELRALADELRAFFAAHPDEARLTVFADERLEPDYRALLEGIDFDTTPLLHYREFREFLAGSEFDFVVNPLRDSPFNRGKSPVKFFEATIAGAVLITSAMPVYKPVEHNVSGITVPWKEGAWRETLEASLAMPVPQRQAIHAGAVRQIHTEFATEANYLPFRTAIEAARLHAVFGPQTNGEQAAILIDDRHDAGLAEAIERILAPHGFRLISATTLGENDDKADLLRRSGVALVHAAAPDSPWLAAARSAGLPALAGWDDAAAVSTRVPGGVIVLADTVAAAAAARAAGYRHALRWTAPPPARWRGFADKPLKPGKDGVRIVSSAGADAAGWLAPTLERLAAGGAAIRFEADCPDAERVGWEAAFAPFAATIPFDGDASGPPERRGVVMTVDADATARRSALEAMSYGIPVIAVAGPEMAELIADGRTGRLVPPDPEAVAGAILETFALPPEDLAMLRERAASTASILAGPAVAAANLVRFYRLAVELARQGKG